MPPRKRNARARAKDLRSRPRRRKVSPLTAAGASYVDYKDVELLRSFVSERAKIRAQRVSGNNRQQQREVARAIKTAREMALIEYARRPMTQRRGDKRRGQRPGDERRPPPDRPSVPLDADAEQPAAAVDAGAGGTAEQVPAATSAGTRA
ncbi:30S ribosomal protein S18 [Candidatus Poriferisodalis sp.]|uniref:30S ribosomal protein S18 n=1 Tax=Candidatus Poriferisodalis sp. TaxID=3101277 RepID=UPI003B020E78